MTRILVTGATGFIGVPVVETLVRQRHDVHVFGRLPPKASTVGAAPGVTFHSIDLLRPDGVAALMADIAPEQLIHLAWNTEPGKFWAAPDNLEWTSATLSLYRAFARAGGRRMVAMGTCAEYDWSAPLLSEATTDIRPATFYGVAKASTFALLREAAALDGIEFAWGRIFFLYGPGEKRGRLVSDVVANLLAGQPALCTEGLQRRDFMHVGDLGRAIAEFAASPVTGALNLASGQCRPVREIVVQIADLIGRPDLLRLGARTSPPGEPLALEADVSRLRNEVGFTCQHDLRSGLIDTIRWYREFLAAETDKSFQN